MPVMSRPSNTICPRSAHLAGQHLEEGALAGAVGADDAAQFAAPTVKSMSLLASRPP
jgi:hypothetical protein